MGKGVNGNLKPHDERSKDEAREHGRLGGIKSGEARRKKKTMREALEMMLFKIELPEQLKDRLRAEGITCDDDMNHQMVITRSLISKAEAGDVQAYHAICGMIGEKPAEQLEVTGDMFAKLRIADDTEENEGLVPTSEDEIPE